MRPVVVVLPTPSASKAGGCHGRGGCACKQPASFAWKTGEAIYMPPKEKV